MSTIYRNDDGTLPAFAMDGSYFSAEPCDYCQAQDDAQQHQSALWAAAGQCEYCGSSDPLTTAGVCASCVEFYTHGPQ